jgi:hypothetical protein
LNEYYRLYRRQNSLLHKVISKQITDSLKTIIDTLELNTQHGHAIDLRGFLPSHVHAQQYKTYDSLLSFSKRINDLPFNNTGLRLPLTGFRKK